MKKDRESSMSYIRGYVKTGHITTLTILSILSATLLVAVAYLTKVVIDAIIGGVKTDIIIAISVMAVLLLVYAIVFGVVNYLSTKIGMLSTKGMILDATHHLMRSKISHDLHSVEQLKIASNDAEIAVTSYVKLFPTISSILVKLIVGISLMMVIDYKITLIAMAIGVVVAVIMLLVKRPMKALHKVAQEKVAISNAYMQEGIKNVELVKTSDVSDYVRDGISKRLDSVRTAIENKARFSNTISSIMYFALEMTFLFVLVYGGTLVYNKSLALSEFVALISIIEIVKAPFMTATNIGNMLYNMLASCERVMTLIERQEDEYIDVDFDSIVFDDVSFSYDNREVIRHLSTTIAKGDKVILSGDSGSGKSTFLRLVSGLITPTSGDIYFVKDGEKIHANGKVYSSSYMPQDLPIFTDTIYNNVTLGRDVSSDALEEALKVASIYDEVNAKGYDFMLGEGGQGLSVGQIERLCIARAIVMDRGLMLLDEPFSALDQKTARDIYARLLAMDKTIIMASHDDFTIVDGVQVITFGEDK